MVAAAKTRSNQSVVVVHDVPGRIRVRTDVLRNLDVHEDALEAYIQKSVQLIDLRLNRRIGSLSIRYQGGDAEKSILLAILQTLPDEIFSGTTTPEQSPTRMDVAASGILLLVGMILPPPLRQTYTVLRCIPFIAKGINTLLTKGLRVDVLDAATVSILTLQNNTNTANAVCFMLDTAEYMEHSVSHRSTKLLKSLLKPKTEKVWIEYENIEREISFDELRIGDLVVVGSGELIPIDGTVICGEALVNQASVTGESLPVHLQPGDQVFAGTVIEEGKLKIDAKTIGSEITTAKISDFITQSLKDQSKNQSSYSQLADKLVPATFGLGAAVFLCTRDLKRTSSVFAVDYSCALKLICPIALKSAMFAIARHGVLVRGAPALESLAEVDTLIFDKTGTVTTGKLSVSAIVSLNNHSEPDVLRIAAAAEEHYTHPIAKAVVAEARNRNLDIPYTSEVDFVVAHGVSAFVDDSEVQVGSRHFIEDDEQIDCSASTEPAARLQEEGNTILYVAQHKQLIGIIALRDTLRPEAVACLNAFRELGIKRMVMLTGDNKITAEAIAHTLNVETRWDLKPEDKADVIAELHASGCHTAFVGDGVNDAPALVAADVGIAMPNGADLAREAASIVLLQDQLEPLVYAYALAIKAQRKIKQSVNSTIAVNSATLLLSIAGLLPPLTSALLHNGGTIASLLYALHGAKSSTAIPAFELKGHTKNESV